MVKKKREKALPAIRLKIVSKPKAKPSVRIPTSTASAQDIIQSVKRDERIRTERRERIGKQITEVRKFGEATAGRIGTLTKKFAGKRVVSRRVLRKPKIKLDLRQQRETENVFDDPNRFFKDKELGTDTEQFFFK